MISELSFVPFAMKCLPLIATTFVFPGWNVMNCALSCGMCDLRDPAVRCRKEYLNITSQDSVSTGSIGKLFESLNDRFPQYGVKIVSRDPWIATFDNFVSPAEKDALLARTAGAFVRSTDTGEMDEMGVTQKIISKSRTSTTAWYVVSHTSTIL